MPAPHRRLLAANRSEIAIRICRSAHELGMRTVAIYSHEDRFALHRFKADEAYEIGRQGEPVRSYLNIQGILDLAEEKQVDVIHPGYGFLSENPEFARECRARGITFVGPRTEVLEQLGDKTAARQIAQQAGVPVLSGSDESLSTVRAARQLARKLGYPVILKAAFGGGGRGMRVVEDESQLERAYDEARREAQAAFGAGDVFLEKFIRRARHIEVQLLGDQHGHLVHVYERDCSLQRRHQKVVEIAPAPHLEATTRQQILDAALAIGRAVEYDNAGTVEFLLDVETNEFYFIEVNPRIQVEHTVTETITGIDLVRAQILVAQGMELGHPQIGLDAQDRVHAVGYAFQCRVTTEDPLNRFIPDYGRIAAYRSAGGLGIRLDAGTAFSGAIITPYYDSLLVKVTVAGRSLETAARRMERCLQEFRIRGVKSNLPFLVNLVNHPAFLTGECTTRFIDEHPELFHFRARRDRATKLLNYLADVAVNGHPLIPRGSAAVTRDPAPVPAYDHVHKPPAGTRQRLEELGPERFCQWVRQQKRLLLTDTTFRDAHQSLLATRVRTYDMLQVADAYAHLCPDLFSIEMWGGATFDTAMRFLKECPWQRLEQLRERIPNVLFQMLLRASNAVGYTNYPDNVVRAFVQEAAAAGIDLFRVFDSLNWLPNMRVAIDAVRDTGKLCEAAICYTGDILDPARTKYDLKYYVEMARELEKMGAHLLGIKDMAGLCKPYAAELLVRTLRQEVGIPIHFHTHDTSGVQAGAILKASEAGVDAADAAISSLSGLTSQPNLNSVVEALRYTPRDSGLDRATLDRLAEYWEQVRNYYAAFEAGIPAPTAEVYLHEMPGGQYTNLFQQARSMGLGPRWHEVCRMYAQVNELFGDVVKVTPSSKVVGDMALFMVTNRLQPADVLDPSQPLSLPHSVIEFFEGRLGQPYGGFPKALQKRILGDRKPLRGRPGAKLPAVDFAATSTELERKLRRKPSRRDVLSHVLYPRVFEDFAAHGETYADVSVLPTHVFFYGLAPNEEVPIEIEPGKTLFCRLLSVGDPLHDGRRTVFFELNGQPRSVTIVDRSLAADVKQRPRAEAERADHVAAPMPGLVVGVAVQVGDTVKGGQKLLSIEAMKMETTVYSPHDGRVGELHVEVGDQVESGDLMLVVEPTGK